MITALFQVSVITTPKEEKNSQPHIENKTFSKNQQIWGGWFLFVF